MVRYLTTPLSDRVTPCTSASYDKTVTISLEIGTPTEVFCSPKVVRGTREASTGPRSTLEELPSPGGPTAARR